MEFITLIDPYPTNDPVRWERFLDLLIEAKLPVKLLMETRVEDVIRDEKILPKYREAGVIHLYLGTEGGSDDQLVALNKGTTVDQNKRAMDLARANDIITEASFMIGGPLETWASIEKTIAEAKGADVNRTDGARVNTADGWWLLSDNAAEGLADSRARGAVACRSASRTARRRSRGA